MSINKRQTSDHFGQVGPRAHHFLAYVSLMVGLSYVFEAYTLNQAVVVPFYFFNDVFGGDQGQHIWGYCHLLCAVMLLMPWWIILRAIAVILSALLWAIFTVLTFWVGLASFQASLTGSFVGILSSAMVVCSVLAASNLRRDFAAKAVDNVQLVR